MPARLHALVQHADDLDQTRRDFSIIKNVDGILDAVAGTDMAEMEAAKAGMEFAAAGGGRTRRISGHSAHRGGKQPGISAATPRAPLLGACRKNMREIGPGGIG